VNKERKIRTRANKEFQKIEGLIRNSNFFRGYIKKFALTSMSVTHTLSNEKIINYKCVTFIFKSGIYEPGWVDFTTKKSNHQLSYA
jgi:hypothetical protein